MRQQYIGSRSFVKTFRGVGARDRYSVWTLDQGGWINESEEPDDLGSDKGISLDRARNLQESLIRKGYKVVEIRDMNPYR